jgi:hypothetical protein
MGMFDYINVEMKCPLCDNILKGFQSKDGDCDLGTISFKTVNNFYISCDNCNIWIEFNYRTKEMKKRKIQDYDMLIHELPRISDFKGASSKNKIGGFTMYVKGNEVKISNFKINGDKINFDAKFDSDKVTEKQIRKAIQQLLHDALKSLKERDDERNS